MRVAAAFFAVLAFSQAHAEVNAVGSPRLVRNRNQMSMEVDSSGDVGQFSESMIEVNEEDSRSSAVQDMLAQVEAMVQSGTDVSGDKINVIKNIVEGELMPDLKATHKAAETQVDVNKAAIDTCNKNMLTRTQQISSSTKVSVGSSRTEHAECRNKEAEHKGTKATKCQELDDFLNGIGGFPSLPDPKGRDAMVHYVETMSKYFCPKGPKAEELDAACTAATNVHSGHREKCNKLQATFEISFCTWRTQLIDRCSAQTQCYDNAKTTFDTHVAATKTLVKKWKVEWAALTKILCYTNVWLSDNNVKTVSAGKLQECDNNLVKTDETSPMHITFPDAPAKATCSLSEVEKYPGTPAFMTAEYSQLQDVGAAIPCTGSDGSTGPKVRIEQAAVRQSNWKGGIMCSWINFKQKFERMPYVQVSVDHRSYKGKGTHDAVTVWMQEIYNDRFKVCVRETAHHNGGHDGNLHIAYMAFEGAPYAGALIGNASWAAYQTDVKCQWMTFARPFKAEPHVVTTIYHQPKYGGNAITEWVQEVQADKFRACVRETAHHDQRHMALHMGYLAWSDPALIDDAQTGRSHFEKWTGGSKCQRINFTKPFSAAPIVQATINHYHRKDSTHDAVTTWMEEVDTTGFRACVRELKQHDGAHDSLNIDWIARA